MHLAGEQVGAVLDRAEPARRRRQPGDPVHPEHPAPPRWQRQGVEEPARAAVLGFGALARLARSHVLGDIDVLAHPKGEAKNQRPGPGSPQVPPERAVVTLAEHLRAQPPAGGLAWSTSPCPRRCSRPQRTRNVPPFGARAGATTGTRSRSTSWPSAAAAPRTMGPKSASTARSTAKVWTKVGERKRSSEGAGGDGARVVPVPSDGSAPASATKIL